MKCERMFVEATQMNTQFTVTYQRKNGEIAQQAYYVDSAEAAKVAFLKYVFGMTETNIVSIVDSTPVAPDIAQRERRIASGKTRISKLSPEFVNEKQLAYLETVKDEVRLRFSWPKEIHDAVVARFAELLVPLPSDARPMDSGKFGGEPMYSLSTELSFPAPNQNGMDVTFPNSRLSKDGTKLEISRVTFSLALVKEGFPVNVYAREQAA